MKLISEEYRELISELHSIGKWGGESTKPRILSTIRDHIGWQQATTLIDYGSGNIEGEERSLKWALKGECNVIEYEPAIKSKRGSAGTFLSKDSIENKLGSIPEILQAS